MHGPRGSELDEGAPERERKGKECGKGADLSQEMENHGGIAS